MARMSKEEKRDKLRQRQAEREAKGSNDFSTVYDLLNLSDYPDLKKFKLKEGDNWVDIIPYEVTTDQHPDGIEEGEDDYKLEVWAHRNMGPEEKWVLCLKATLGRKCPICEYKDKLLSDGKDRDSKEVKALNASKRCFYNVFDVSDNPETEDIQLFENTGASKPTKWFEALVNSEAKAGDETIAFYDLEEGRTIKVRASLETFQKNEYVKPERIDFEDRPPYDEAVYDEVLPLEALLVIPSYDEVEAIFQGGETPDKEDSKKSETAKRSKRSKRSSTKEEKQEDKKEESKSSRRSSRKSKTEEPEKELTEEEDEAISGKCPCDYTFGVDFDSKDKDGCITCPDDDFNACGDAADLIKKAEKEKEKPVEKSKSKSRRGKRR